MARPAGIEPATAGLEGRCSIRLSYGRLTQQKLESAKRIFQADVRVRANRIGSARGLYRTFLPLEAYSLLFQSPPAATEQRAVTGARIEFKAR